MGKKVELLTDDPCVLEKEEEEESLICKCVKVCKCLKYKKGKKYKTDAEKCELLKKGHDLKCKGYKTCKKTEKQWLYAECEQYKPEKKKKDDGDKRARKLEKKAEKKAKKLGYTGKKSKCRCEMISKYEDEARDMIDEKCDKHNETEEDSKKEKKRGCKKKQDDVTILSCSCETKSKNIKKANKNVKNKNEVDKVDLLYESCITNQPPNEEISKDALLLSHELSCKEKEKKSKRKKSKEKKCKADKKKCKCGKKKKQKCICSKKKCEQKEIKERRKRKKKEEKICQDTCIKFVKEEKVRRKRQKEKDLTSADESESEKKRKKKKTREEKKREKECEKKRIIEEFERLEEEKRRLQCLDEQEQEEYFKLEPGEEEPTFLLPNEYKALTDKEKFKREEILKSYLRLHPEPYRCVRTCIDPETAKLKYQEYICYPPQPTPPSICQHPPILFPKDCLCKHCTEESCASNVCESIRRLRARLKYEEPDDSAQITICVPVPDPPPPIVCADCPLEIREKELDFHIVTHKNIKKHMRMMNKKVRKIVQDWEKKNEQRKLNITRFC